MTYHRIDNDSDGNLLRFYYHKKKENRVSKFDFRNLLNIFKKYNKYIEKSNTYSSPAGINTVASQTYEKSSRVVIFVFATQLCDIKEVQGYKPETNKNF